MKRKGFTLVELLAVIVILSVIALIATPMILNIIEETKKRSLENSVKGLLEASNYFAIENNGVYEFIFDETHKGTTKQGERLDYKGELDAKGKLYIDEEGDISLCVYNDKYYAYKNYNSGVIIGEKSKDNCNIDYDGLTNKYVAYLESEGMSSNVYTKEEVNELVQELKNKIEKLENNNYATKEELTNTSDNLTNTINENKANIDSVKNGLNEYALKSELSNTNNNLITTNSNLDALTSIVNDNKSNIDILKDSIKTDFKFLDDVNSTGDEQLVLTYDVPPCKWFIVSAQAFYNYSAVEYIKIADAEGHILAYMDNSTSPSVSYIRTINYTTTVTIKVYVKWSRANTINSVLLHAIYGV